MIVSHVFNRVKNLLWSDRMNKYIMNENIGKPIVSITIGCYLKCGNNSITVSERSGVINCVAHGSLHNDEICPKGKDKFKFKNNCLINR